MPYRQVAQSTHHIYYIHYVHATSRGIENKYNISTLCHPHHMSCRPPTPYPPTPTVAHISHSTCTNMPHSYHASYTPCSFTQLQKRGCMHAHKWPVPKQLLLKSHLLCTEGKAQHIWVQGRSVIQSDGGREEWVGSEKLGGPVRCCYPHCLYLTYSLCLLPHETS